MDQIVKEIIVVLGTSLGLIYTMVRYIIIPLTSKHIEFVDKALLNMDKMTVAIQSINERLEVIHENTRGEL